MHSKPHFTIGALAAACLLIPFHTHAHIGYGGRDFGSFSSATPKELGISVTNVSGAFGWADGTDSDWGDSHKLRAFRFTLVDPQLIAITVQASGALLPGYSLFSGLGDLESADHEGAPVTVSYLNAIGGKEGAFIALGTWKIASDADASEATMTTFTYMGHAADGTAANYGNAPGVSGDGLANGFVTQTFNLEAGNYSIFVGGARYSAQDPIDPTNYGATVTVANVPEPATVMSLLVGSAVLCSYRRRRH